MTKESKWAARVAAWRGSGLSAARFCADKEFTEGTLRYWASKLRGAEPTLPAVRMAKVVRADVPTETEVDASIVLDVGGVRVVVRRGFDRDVLCDVLDALGSRSA